MCEVQGFIDLCSGWRPQLRRKLGGLALSAFLLLSTLAEPVHACAFHFSKPDRTPIDWIVQADDLILARPSSEHQFTYEVIEVLAGTGVGAAVPDLVDSVTRRRLAARADDAVLFARETDGEWRRIAYIGSAFRPVLDTALRNRVDWQAGYSAARRDLITGLQNSPDPALQSLVIAEFDRMPYAMLRETEIAIPTERLLADLWTTSGYSYQAVRVLLLGLSGDIAARDEIHGYVDRSQAAEQANNLGAFAAALIEMDGARGVQKLADGLLADLGQPLDKLEQVMMAFSVQNAVASSDVRMAINSTVQEFIAQRPEAGPIVARQFALRSDWSQVGALAPLVQQRLLSNSADLMTVSVYLAQARLSNSARLIDPKRGG